MVSARGLPKRAGWVPLGGWAGVDGRTENPQIDCLCVNLPLANPKQAVLEVVGGYKATTRYKIQGNGTSFLSNVRTARGSADLHMFIYIYIYI